MALFRDTAKKLAALSGLREAQVELEMMDSEEIQVKIVPRALALFKTELPLATFCDEHCTPLVSLARSVSDLLLTEFSCHSPPAVLGAMLADLPNLKEVELKILQMFGEQSMKVWKEVKLFLDPKKCEVAFSIFIRI